MARSIETLIDFIKARRSQLNLSQRELAAKAGINAGTLANIELGRVTRASRPDTLEALAKGLEVPAEVLLRIAGYGSYPLSTEHARLVELLTGGEGPPRRRRSGQRRPDEPPGGLGVPYFGKVGCGLPIDLAAEPLDWLIFDGFTVREREVAVQACGDSMDRVGIVDGVYLVVEPGATAHSGKIVIANLGGEGCTCKRYRVRKAGHVIEHWLWPESTDPRHAPHRMGARDRILGVVKRHVAEH